MAPTRRSAKKQAPKSKPAGKAPANTKARAKRARGKATGPARSGRHAELGPASRRKAAPSAPTMRRAHRGKSTPRSEAPDAAASRAHPTSGERAQRLAGTEHASGRTRRPARPLDAVTTTGRVASPPTHAPAQLPGLTSDARRVGRRQRIRGGAGSEEAPRTDAAPPADASTATARERSSDVVSKKVMRAAARSHTTDSEPSDQELSFEQSRIDEEAEIAAKARRTPAPGKDLLASYMEQLSHIPLFTPQQEIENARHLETLELKTLLLLLGAPKAVEHLADEAGELEVPLRTQIDEILQSYRRAATRSPTRDLPASPKREKLKQHLAEALRFADFDKELLERVLTRVRRETWERRVLGPNQAFRLNHAVVSEIEQARAASVCTRNNFVRANLRLVVSVARNFHHYRIPFIDLIQEGNVGLMKAVHRFDHRRGFRFSTYAHWWIRQSIERAIINKGSQVRLPVHVIDSRRQVGRASAQLTQALGRSPTSGEIARRVKMPANKVEQILGGVQQDPVSLDESVGSDDPRKFVDLVRDENATAVDDLLIRENTHDRIRELMHLLNPIERDIIRRRFGLGDDSDQTLDEIGRLYNLSRERVRQIQAQGLMKMRRMCDRRRIS